MAGPAPAQQPRPGAGPSRDGRVPRRRPGRRDPDPLARGQDGPDRRRAVARSSSSCSGHRGIKSLDLVVVSHHHADHYGGMDGGDPGVPAPRVPGVGLVAHHAALPEAARAGPRPGHPGDPADGPAATDRAGLGRPDGLSPGRRRIGPRRTTTRSGSGSSTARSRSCSRATPSRPSDAGGSGTSPTSSGIARCSSWPTTAAATAPTPVGWSWSGPSWRWPAWGRGNELRASQPPDDRPAGPAGDSAAAHRPGRHGDDRERRRALAGRRPRRQPRGDRPPGRPRSKAKHEAKPKPAGAPINVNTATQAELEALPGIGPVIARRIIEGRPYRSVDDLDRVKGIGKKRLEEIRPLVTAE